MAISKKGLRTIIIDDVKYYWKFKNEIFIFHSEFKNSTLSIDFGYYDIWLYVNDKENTPPDFEPKIVTPKFISESIKFALANGWNMNKLKLKFRDKAYKIIA